MWMPGFPLSIQYHIASLPVHNNAIRLKYLLANNPSPPQLRAIKTVQRVLFSRAHLKPTYNLFTPDLGCCYSVLVRIPEVIAEFSK